MLKSSLPFIYIESMFGQTLCIHTQYVPFTKSVHRSSLCLHLYFASPTFSDLELHAFLTPFDTSSNAFIQSFYPLLSTQTLIYSYAPQSYAPFFQTTSKHYETLNNSVPHFLYLTLSSWSVGHTPYPIFQASAM